MTLPHNISFAGKSFLVKQRFCGAYTYGRFRSHFESNTVSQMIFNSGFRTLHFSRSNFQSIRRSIHTQRLHHFGYSTSPRVPLFKINTFQLHNKYLQHRTMATDTTESSTTAVSTSKHKYIDVGINLSDPIFQGKYHGKQAHDPDLDDVISRALDVGCVKLMITGSNLKESKAALDLADKYPGTCYATIGVHPCSSLSFPQNPSGPDALLSQIKSLALDSAATGRAVAFGEIGLDYDRLFLCPKDVQLLYFEKQLDLAVDVKLPLFLHSRAAAEDFEKLLTPRLSKIPKGGLVHSFTGTKDELYRLLNLGLDIGVNGCSLKTRENLEVVKEIPLNRLQLETDGPWCEIRPSHASAAYLKTDDAPVLPKSVKKEKWIKGAMVKGRNEPCTIVAVAHVVAAVKGVPVAEVVDAAWRNSVKMFGLGESV